MSEEKTTIGERIGDKIQEAVAEIFDDESEDEDKPDYECNNERSEKIRIGEKIGGLLAEITSCGNDEKKIKDTIAECVIELHKVKKLDVNTRLKIIKAFKDSTSSYRYEEEPRRASSPSLRK